MTLRISRHMWPMEVPCVGKALSGGDSVGSRCFPHGRTGDVPKARLTLTNQAALASSLPLRN